MRFKFAVTLLILVLVTLSAVMQESQSVTFGEAVEVQTPVEVTFSLDRIQPVTFVVRSLDGQTTPVFTLINQNNAVVLTVGVNATYRADMGINDVGIQDLMLVPGTYAISITNTPETGEPRGDGQVRVEVYEGSVGTLGAGYTEIIETPLDEANPFLLRALNFTAGDVVSIGVASLDNEELDTIMYLISPSGDLLARNDDHESDVWVLDFTDSMIARYVVPETGMYTLVAGGFDEDVFGTVRLIVSRLGTLEATTDTAETYEGRVLTGGRQTYIVEASAGELVTFEARGISPELDTVMTVYDPNGLIIAQNDDQDTLREGLGQFDSLLENFYVPMDGRYMIDIEAYDNSGDFVLSVIPEGVLVPSLEAPETPLIGDVVPLPDIFNQ